MTVEIQGTLTDGKNARVMHDGVSLAYTVNQANTTAVDSSTYDEDNIGNGLTGDRYKPNATSWTIEIDLDGGAASATTICIGSDDMFTSGQTVNIQYDNSGFTTIDSVTPTDDSPIMFLFEAQSSAKWRITGSGTAKPTIYNVMIGNALKMERPFYAGHRPARMNRQVEVMGNISGSGGLLGRSTRRTILTGGYSWEHLTRDWVRTNLDGTSGLIQSLETKPGYIAWRPSEENDCDYIMRADTNPPEAQGIRNLHTFSMTAEVYAYE